MRSNCSNEYINCIIFTWICWERGESNLVSSKRFVCFHMYTSKCPACLATRRKEYYVKYIKSNGNLNHLKVLRIAVVRPASKMYNYVFVRIVYWVNKSRKTKKSDRMKDVYICTMWISWMSESEIRMMGATTTILIHRLKLNSWKKIWNVY